MACSALWNRSCSFLIQFQARVVLIVSRGWISAAQSSFREVGASEEMVKALRGIGIERPSFIQAAACQVLTSAARHVVLADHAGGPPVPASHFFSHVAEGQTHSSDCLNLSSPLIWLACLVMVTYFCVQ